VFSALEVFYENALYKFTFNIDIDIDINAKANSYKWLALASSDRVIWLRSMSAFALISPVFA